MKKEGKEEVKKKKLKAGEKNQASRKKLERTTERRLEKNKNKRSGGVTG